jgi:hypothetical protein
MALALAARSPDAIIGPGGGPNLIKAALVTSKAGLLVAAGYGSAELGSSILRASFDTVEQFASKGALQSALVKAAPSLIVTLIVTMFTYRAGARMGVSRAAAAAGAAKVAILMMLGMGISMVKEPLSKLTVDLQSRVSAAIAGVKTQKALPSGQRAAGSNLPDNVVDMRRAGAERMFYGDEGAVPFGTGGADAVPRAGGDSGFGPAPSAPNTDRIQRTETW